MRNIKLVVLPMLVMLGLLATGFAYAHWSETLYISGTVTTSELDWEFVKNSFMCKDIGLDWTCDPYTMADVRQLDKNVGSTTGVLSDSDADGDNDTLTITIDNAYPCYYNELSVKVHNNGIIALHTKQPVIVWGGQEISLPIGSVLVLKDVGGNDVLEIRWMEPAGDQIHPCEQREISFELHVLQGASESTAYTFTIKMPAVEWSAP